MKTIIDRADTRGHAEHGWLDTYHTFSFAGYHNPTRMGFGALRVLNDDKVAPGKGFDTHPHDNMEIVSIPLKGSLKHGDSTNNQRVITVGDIQVMSAGTGIMHSERNASMAEPVEFLQIWVFPKYRNTKPGYQDFSIRDLIKKNEFSLIISPDREVPATLGQETWFSIGNLDKGAEITYRLHGGNHGIYIFVIDGEIDAGGTVLERRDGMGAYETPSLTIKALSASEVLLMEVPMY